MPRISSLIQSQPLASSRLKSLLPPGSDSRLLPIIKALPENFGTVRKIISPKKDTDLPAAAGRIVIHIQDVHRNSEAQANIGRAVQELINQKKVDLVALEGAFAPMDFSWYRRYPYQDSVKAVADYLLKEKRISGPVYTAFTLRLRSGQALPPFVGVDEKNHYDANVKAYQQCAPLVPSYKKKLERDIRELNEAKAAVFKPRHKEFDNRVEAYRKGSLSWGEYVRALSKQTDLSLKVKTYLTALEMEEKLNFAEVETERTRLIAQLVAKLNKAETDELLSLSVAYRSGGLTALDFYSRVKDLCAKRGLNLARFPAMDEYIRYVLLSESLDVDGILKEAASAEKGIYDTLAKTEEERRLVASSRYFYLVGKLLDFALTKEEWEEYKSIGSPPLVGGARGGELFTRNPQENNKEILLSPSPYPRPQGAGKTFSFDLSSFENFYSEAEARDEAMSLNLEKAMDSSHAKVAVLVTGGFHSGGILRRLQPKGFTVVSYVPKISKIEDANGSAYLSVFTQEKTPLDKLFAGEKLFLSERQLADSVFLREVVGTTEKAGTSGVARKIFPWGRLTVVTISSVITSLVVEKTFGELLRQVGQGIFRSVNDQVMYAGMDQPMFVILVIFGLFWICAKFAQESSAGIPHWSIRKSNGILESAHMIHHRSDVKGLTLNEEIDYIIETFAQLDPSICGWLCSLGELGSTQTFREWELAKFRWAGFEVASNAFQSVKRKGIGSIEVNVRRDGTEAIFNVLDQGKGISRRILDKLVVMKGVTTKRRDGRGFGLWETIVPFLLEEKGRRVEIQTRDEEGVRGYAYTINRKKNVVRAKLDERHQVHFPAGYATRVGFIWSLQSGSPTSLPLQTLRTRVLLEKLLGADFPDRFLPKSLCWPTAGTSHLCSFAVDSHWRCSRCGSVDWISDERIRTSDGLVNHRWSGWNHIRPQSWQPTTASSLHAPISYRRRIKFCRVLPACVGTFTIGESVGFHDRLYCQRRFRPAAASLLFSSRTG